MRIIWSEKLHDLPVPINNNIKLDPNTDPFPSVWSHAELPTGGVPAEEDCRVVDVLCHAGYVAQESRWIAWNVTKKEAQLKCHYTYVYLYAGGWNSIETGK